MSVVVLERGVGCSTRLGFPHSRNVVKGCGVRLVAVRFASFRAGDPQPQNILWRAAEKLLTLASLRRLRALRDARSLLGFIPLGGRANLWLGGADASIDKQLQRLSL